MDSPWITFEVDLTRMPSAFWMQLGEARSKCDHLARVPMPPSYTREFREINLSKGVHATTAIEGNTLSEEEVVEIVRRRPVSASTYQVQEVKNVVDAYNGVLIELQAGASPMLTPELAQIYATSGPKTLARDLNELVSIGLLRVVEGRYEADSEVPISLSPLTVPPNGG